MRKKALPKRKGGIPVVRRKDKAKACLLRALETRKLLRFATANAVQRTFCQLGESWGLDPNQLYPHGPHLGQGDEIWLASWKLALNDDDGCPADEGMSYLVGINGNGKEVAIPFDVALEIAGEILVGIQRVTGWPYAKIFSNLFDIPNHFHLTQADSDEVGADGSKWESYLLLVEFMLRVQARPFHFPAGLYTSVDQGEVARYMYDKNWGDPRWDGRAVSPGHLMGPNMGAHMPPGVPHAPTGGIPFFELMEPADNFIMMSGYQDKIITPGDLRWRHMRKDMVGKSDVERARYVAGRIDYEASHKCWKSNNVLKPIPDTDNDGFGVEDGVDLVWGIYGKTGGKERYTAKRCRMKGGTTLKLSKKPCAVWCIDGGVNFEGQRLGHSRLIRIDEPLYDLGLKVEGHEVDVVNEGPNDASLVMWYGPDTHGENMPSYPGQLA